MTTAVRKLGGTLVAGSFFYYRPDEMQPDVKNELKQQAFFVKSLPFLLTSDLNSPI
jgi:hypothetical protein